MGPGLIHFTYHILLFIVILAQLPIATEVLVGLTAKTRKLGPSDCCKLMVHRCFNHLTWRQSQEHFSNPLVALHLHTCRYAKNPSLVGVQLINEPLSPGVSLETLNKYYKAGYDAVRKHSSMAYVIMANRLGPADSKEFLPLASGRTGTVIDVHFYNLFSDIVDNMTVQENIDFVQTNRSSQQNVVNTSNGPLTFVGEWVTEWQVRGATKEDFQRFAKAQLEVYGQATFGWAYWTLKNVNNHWSLEWMIKNNYMTL